MFKYHLAFNAWQALKDRKPALGRLPARKQKKGKSLLEYR